MQFVVVLANFVVTPFQCGFLWVRLSELIKNVLLFCNRYFVFEPYHLLRCFKLRILLLIDICKIDRQALLVHLLAYLITFFVAYLET